MPPPNDLPAGLKSARTPTAEERALTVAQTAQANAEARKAANEADDAANKAAISRLAREQQQRDVDDLLAGDEHNRVYRFVGKIDEASVKSAIDRLTAWHRLYPGQPIEIIFTSEGGDITDGMALFDVILGLSRAGHVVTTSALGLAASMAAILVQAGDIRSMGRESSLMFHEAGFQASGRSSEIKDISKWVDATQERVLTMIAARSKKMTIEELREKCTRRTWYLDADQSLALGLVDVIR
ncbi:MAG: ATP-dependent Clp protease proteolytic subunit [Actinomycetota bacterium]